MWKKCMLEFLGLLFVALLVGSMLIHNSVKSDFLLKNGKSVSVVNGEVDRPDIRQGQYHRT